MAGPTSNQSHECLGKITLSLGLFEPCVVPKWLISTQFDSLARVRAKPDRPPHLTGLANPSLSRQQGRPSYFRL
jgi:hypothetical protein